MKKNSEPVSLVYSYKELCKTCYTCVRECPVKAIRLVNGQAEVIYERCIACGNCVRVCARGAKTFTKSTAQVINLLLTDKNVMACIAPSFPAEFSEIDNYKVLVGMVKALGFKYVTEVAFGADLVAREYSKLLKNDNTDTIISSDCPAIVHFIKQYHPNLVKNLAPVVSPMIAMARVVRKMYNPELKIVFIGPCIAKKTEPQEVDFVLTFSELREMFIAANITHENIQPIDFDEPHAGLGSILPINRGLLRNIEKPVHFTDADIITARGHNEFKELIKEIDEGFVDSKYIEVHCCQSCIMGPGMSKNGQIFKRRLEINRYVKEKLNLLDTEKWEKQLNMVNDIDLSCNFTAADRRLKNPDKEQIKQVLTSMGKNNPSDLLNCGACGYATCEEHAIAVLQNLAQIEMCLPYTIEKLHKTILDLNVINTELENTQKALKHSEKLAGMGQLSAGIAHELNNPLGVITMYSNILLEETNPESSLFTDIKLIAEQAERCKNIVGGLLNFARKNQLKYTNCNIEELIKQSFESIIHSGNLKINFKSELKQKSIPVDSDQLMQVFTNLEKNAVEAMPENGILTVLLTENENDIQIEIADNGSGIAPENMDKLFTPFFTTKERGKGTGLGLSIIYGIIKMHRGRIVVESNNNPVTASTGTKFIVNLPKKVII